MSTQNGQNQCPHCKVALPAEEAQSAPKISQMLTPAQAELLQIANYLDGPDLVNALKLLHDVVIYHSEIPLDEEEKTALFSVKGLWECIQAIEKD